MDRCVFRRHTVGLLKGHIKEDKIERVRQLNSELYGQEVTPHVIYIPRGRGGNMSSSPVLSVGGDPERVSRRGGGR